MAPLFAFFAALCWGTSSVVTRLGLRHMRSTTATLLSMVVSLLLILVITLIFDLDMLIAIPAIALGWLALSGVLNFVVGRLLNTASVGMAGASRSSPIVSISPLFAAIFAFIFLGERPNLLVIFGTLAIIGSVSLIVSQSLSDSNNKDAKGKTVLLGCLIALGAAIGYGTNYVVTREVLTGYSTPLAATTISLAFGTVFLLPLCVRDVPELKRAPAEDIWFIVLSGTLQGLGVYFMMVALSRAPVVVASPISSLSPLVALVLAHFMLKRMERITPRIIVGTVLAVAGVVLVVLGRNL
jgi:drug/metabolite transporter (DMT)-like permease